MARARGTRGVDLVTLFYTFFISFLRDVNGQVAFNEITGFSLNPPYFNLAEGARISATATCGQDESGRPRSDLYCKLVGGPTTELLTQNIQGQFCDHCNSNEPNKAHPVTNAIDGTERWWQSPPLSKGLGYNEVNVTLDLEQLFHVAYVLIKFANSPRPDLWVLERSVDHGRTYSPWQYFAHSKRECIERFGLQPNARVIRDDDQICTTEYSRILPVENGEIVVSLVNGRPGSKNFTYSPVLRDFTKATNIRLHFLRTSTLLGHLISKTQRDPTVTRRYYYSIKDISIGGRCVCHGHAEVCGGRNQDGSNRLQCECKHNTCGESCDRCCPGFNQKPWRAATTGSPNQCQPCQCFSHASDCYYDPEVEQRGASLDTLGRYHGGGVCISCQHNTAGVNCERCIVGFYRPHGIAPESPSGCIPCSCNDRTTAGCEMGSGRCICKPQFSGEHCDRCAGGYYGYPRCIPYPTYLKTTASPVDHSMEPTPCPLGYFRAPSCQRCDCNYYGSVYEVCDASGRCLCRPRVEGEQCDRCQPGYYSFPDCQACSCDGAGVAGKACAPNGQCSCLANYAGQQCDQCAAGYYGYPDCGACQCSREGSYDTACNPLSGQCLCLPGVVGQQCDRCAGPGPRFPPCSAFISQCNLAGSEVMDPHMGSCRCLPNVEGVLCNKCKPLFWNLATNNPSGCIECQCDVKGTLSGVGECQQQSGQCHCKPNACGHACNTCEDGYFKLQRRNYFGCQGCQCDVGGSTTRACLEVSGQCHCRKNVAGLTCTEAASGYYFPSLHQLKFEVEDGTCPNARPVRFGYDAHEFPGFSWRGYAVMSPAQPEVALTLAVGFPGPFNLALRYVTAGTKKPGRVRASMLLVDDAGFHSCCDWAGQSKEVVFPASQRPSFLTVPGDGFAEPFALTPGTWTFHIRAQGILLDYLVLLPRDYYEASLLQQKITQPCTCASSSQRHQNCLLYKHVPMEAFSSVLGSQGTLSTHREHRKRQAHVRRITPDHPEMTWLSGRQSQLQLSLRVVQPGTYALILEYASEEEIVQNVNIFISSQSNAQVQARANIYSCAFSFLCRSVVVDSRNRVTMFHLTHKAELLLQTSTASFLLYKVYAVPAGDFTMEYVEPKELCVSFHGRFTEDSQYCVPSHSSWPTEGWLLDAARVGTLSSILPVSRETEEWRRRRQSEMTALDEPQIEGVLLKSPQTEISLSLRVPLQGRYVVLVHYRQAEHISFPAEVRVDAGRSWMGFINASFCPSVSGCREVVIADDRIALDFDPPSWRNPTITVRVPAGKTFVLDYILVVRDSSYTPDLLKEKPLDMSGVFIQRCRGDGFYIDPRTSSRFCMDAARSLTAAYNDGALPCSCDKSGSTGTTCDPIGGQCPCREHVIGRQCSKCATGYFGFPYCRPCQCGRRLCDEVTGTCICPPQTIRPACDVCQSQTFSYHPMLGCEGCACSPNGIKANAGPDCDRNTGQCTCKPGIGGRQCDRCAAAYYGFPDCVPCDCNPGGVTSDVCHLDTGRCLCKSNVQGVRCDACRPGAFYFQPSNPNGCIGCFCFGATDRCQPSRKRRGKSVDMHGWRLERPDQEEVPSALNPVSNTVVADVQELSRAVTALYWVAPLSYLGDRVSSYGGFLTFQSKSFGIPSEGMTLLDRRPDVVLSGRHMSLVHMAAQLPSPDRMHHGRVQLVEGNWRHAVTNRPVSREELMMVLAGLVGLRVRALYFSQSQRLSLGEVGLEEATHTGTGGPANTVEECSCPPEYSGESCQKCAPGYYRDGSGPFLGRCVPCDCNGFASECEERTGRCLNCRQSTAGDRCENCKEGYYRNRGDAEKVCILCPCPLSVAGNSFAVGCRPVFNGFECICRTGYSGERCERCAPGYYGDPSAPRGRCQPCNCNENGNSCDPISGVCTDTLEPKDTDTDARCQECDSCTQTLLSDLEKLDDELTRLKTELDSASDSASSKEKLLNLEKAISDTKALVITFNNTINKQELKVTQLDEDMFALKDDIDSLKAIADKKATEADKVAADVDKTQQRAKDLNAAVQAMFKKIQALLDKLNDAGTGGGWLPTEGLSKGLEEAKRMVDEMERRNFNPQNTAANKERDEAKKLLENVKANVSDQTEQNQEAADRIRGLLTKHETRLKELEDALKEARDLVKKANTQNGLNTKAMEGLLKRIENIKEEDSIVRGQIDMAKGELQKTEDLLKMLADSKNEYEQLADQMDGAKSDLIKKVNEISQAAKKEDIVTAAEEHAKNLNKLAMDLQDAVRNASGRSDVRDAMQAVAAYKNITDAINAAEAAANEAQDAAAKALDDVKKEDLAKRAKYLKENGTNLLKNAKDAKQSLQEATADLSAQKKRLKDAKEKEKALEKDLLDVQEEMKNIKRDDISGMINDAKRNASLANDTSNTVMDRLNTIKEDIAKVKVPSLDSNFSSVMDDVDKSVKNLLNIIPSLEDTISEVVNLSTNFSPLVNMTENIKKIKELIEEARDAANRVVVPMKFTGEGHVELRPPRDLDDLKAYTSMSLSLQRPELSGRGDGRRRRRQTSSQEDSFVLYLGDKDSSKDYIGMVIRQNLLYCVYKLNGVEYEIETESISRSASEPALFDKVDLYRIYQDAEVVLTKSYTANTPSPERKVTNQGDQSKNLLNLKHSNVVFYIGGYPANFTPPASLNYSKYQGCIELYSFNNKFISLYNFQNAVNVNMETPCRRYLPRIDAYFSQGTGYAKVSIDRPTPNIYMTLTLTTRSETGVLFYIGNEDKYYCVTIERGYVVLYSNLITAPVRSAKRFFPVKEAVSVLFYIRSREKEIKVTVSSEEAVTISTDYTAGQFKEYYIGGIPKDLREKNNISVQAIRGCLRNIQLNNNFVSLVEMEGMGIVRSCTADMLAIRNVEFSLGSSLSADLSGFSPANDFTVSLGFKTTENNGLLLENSQSNTDIELEIADGYVVLRFKGKVWQSLKKYQDNQWHYVTVSLRAERIELLIDDEDAGQELSSSSTPAPLNSLLFLGKDTFSGCLSNLYTRRPENLYRAEDLSYFASSGDVTLDTCTTNTPTHLMMDSISRKDYVKAAVNENLSVCAQPALIPHAYRMGGAVSSLSYGFSPQALQPNPYFSLEVRTRSPEGLLFYAATRRGRSHLALYMSKGRIRLSVGKQKEIFNREKYNDGKWHSVIFSIERKKFRLVVDGIRAQDGQMTMNEVATMDFISPLYLGSAPEPLHKELKVKILPKHSVLCCIRNFKMNGKSVPEPTTNHGAGPCFDGQTQSGAAYFSGKGAYAIINDSFVVGPSFEMLFDVRPRSLTGMLLYVGNFSRSRDGQFTGHYLSLYMLRGEVIAHVMNKGSEYMVSVMPKTSICDGSFHKISVIKRKNVVQLDVDTVGNYKIGPPSSSTTLSKDQLYVGGIPETPALLTLPVTPSFVGCIQDMTINSNLVSFQKVSGVFGPVNIRECPAA